MRKIYAYIMTLFCCLFITSCNDEWKDELYEKTISFGKTGYVEIYVKYDAEGGVIPYKIPVLVSGSTANSRNIEVTIAVDNDTLSDLNFERFRSRTDLYFKQLPEDSYEFKSMTTIIPKGENVGLIDLNLKIKDLDLIDKYILPLRIASTSDYEPNPQIGRASCRERV